MFDWLQKTKRAPLTGAPAVRRQKTFSSQSGFVYQYLYEGQRPAGREQDQGAEYVFDVSADRKTSFPVSVVLSDAVLAGWEQRHERTLTPTERYAIAKMALFQAFDERESPARMKEDVRVRTSDIDAILETLGID